LPVERAHDFTMTEFCSPLFKQVREALGES